MKRISLDTSVLFEAQRIETPHPIIDLREMHPAGVRWRVKAETVRIETKREIVTDASLIRDRSPCRCRRCGKHKNRRGGKNINHKFICAECLK